MNRTIIIKIKKNNITYSNVDGYQTAGTTLFGLSAGSASIERILCDKQLEFGVCNSAKFEAQIFNITTDVMDCQIEVLASDVTDPIFVGKIDSSKKDETNEYRNIIAYDNLYTARDKDIAEAWNGTDIWEDENPITLKTLRNRLCVAAGLTVSTSQPTLPNDDELIPARFATFTSAKFGTIIKMVCELQGSFPIITADGKVKFIQLTTSATDITDNCDTNESEFEDYETSPIDAINVYSTSNDLTQTVGASNPTNAYPISGNIFLLSIGATFVTRVLQATLSAISPIVYTPATLELIIGDLSLQIGDCVQIYRAGNQYIHYIFGTTLYDSLLVRQSINCPATGSKLDESSSASNDPLIFGEMFTKVEQTVEGISAIASSKNKTYRQSATPVGATVGDLWYFTGITTSTRENGKWYRYNGSTWELTEDAGIDANRAELQIQSTQIEARVTKTGGTDATFSWNLTADGFILKSNNETVFQCNSTGINVTGSITATSGTIGGWTISLDEIWNGTAGISAGEDYTKESLVSYGTSPVRFYCGDGDRVSGKFVVLDDGSLYAEAAKITGDIIAKSGTFYDGCSIGSTGGGFQLSSCSGLSGKPCIYYNSDQFSGSGGIGSASNNNVYIGVDGLSYHLEYGGIYESSELNYNTAIRPAIVFVSGNTRTNALNYYATAVRQDQIQFYWGGSDDLRAGARSSQMTASIETMQSAYMQLNGNWHLDTGESVTSDRNKKHDIADLGDAYEILFDSLLPKTYKYNYGTSNRTHTGFIAQDVKAAIEASGLSTQDFAGYIEATIVNKETGEEDLECSLRYSEFIALNTNEIQKLKARIAELERRINNG